MKIDVRQPHASAISLDASPAALTSAEAAATRTPVCVPVPMTHGRHAPATTYTGSLIETTKPGITRLVTITSAVGFIMAAVQQPNWTLSGLALTALGATIGTALSAAGANALNQYWERHRDAMMRRTSGRPLPTGRVTPAAVLGLGLVLALAGVATLLIFTNLGAGLVSAACVLIYVLIYTPLKLRTTLATIVGAIPGALPPLIGWSAAHAPVATWSDLTPLAAPAGLALFALMFFWQLPHFLAIAWMYRDDYAAGGYRVLPVLDATGRRTARAVALWTAALIPTTLAPAFLQPDHLGWVYIAVAALTGLAFTYLVTGFVVSRDRPAARTVFFASIMHLPLLMGAMVIESVARTFIPG